MSSPVAQIRVQNYIGSFEEKENNVITEAMPLRLHFPETQGWRSTKFNWSHKKWVGI